jgi:hypothetical protein
MSSSTPTTTTTAVPVSARNVVADKRETSILGTGSLYSIVSAVYVVGFLHVLYRACEEAYKIRLYAIQEYGPISTFFYILYKLICLSLTTGMTRHDSRRADSAANVIVD